MPRNKPHSEETKRKIGLANRGVWINYFCDYCGKKNEEKKSHYKKKKRHFCNRKCYSNYVREYLPREEQNAYKGGGMPEHERLKRIKVRNITNHALRDGKIFRKPCQVCGERKSQAHHWSYDKPFDIKWLCIKCHFEEHKLIFENPELL